MSTPRLVALALLLSFTLVTGPAQADQVILKNGNVIEGQVTVDEARKKVHVKKAGGVTFSFGMDEVVKVLHDDSAPQPEDEARAPTGGPVEAVVIPLQSGFNQLKATDSFDEALEEALTSKPKLIVFEISSPGGAIAVAQHFANRIMALECRTAAFVDGPGKGAFSAAAYVALSCDRIYMAPGQAIGAAVAWKPGTNGAPKAVSAKFNSAWEASFRATAEANGHPTAIAQAMVSAEDGVAEVTLGEERSFVPATRFYKRDKQGTLRRIDPPEGVKVKILCKPGRVLTLTTREARRVGVCRGVAEDVNDFLVKLKIPLRQTKRLDDPLDDAKGVLKKEQGKLDKAIAEFNKRYEKLVADAPGNHVYELEPDGQFKDGGRAWRRRTKASLSHTKRALKQLEDIQERLDRYPDLQTDRQAVAAYTTKLQAFEKELTALRYTKGPPGRGRR